MSHTSDHTYLSRRDYLRLSAAAIAGLGIPGAAGAAGIHLAPPMTRRFGKIPFEVTSFGLGGQAAIQWTPEGVEPAAIIEKAFRMGINYFDTSNAYGPSQLNFGKAFRRLGLVPGREGYNKQHREGIFLTSKTMVRWAAPGYPLGDKVRNFTEGSGDGAVADLKRALSQMFGNDDGGYPEGAYLDMMLIHNLTTMEEVEAVYTGLHTPPKPGEPVGALAALRDYRDGTNRSGLNPGREKLVRHLGFSGHHDPKVMVEMIQRDDDNLLDAMLVSLNVNDRRYFNMQDNAIPVARAKNMGVIAMKVFADGAMYTKEARWSSEPRDVVRIIGTEDLPSRPLIEYVLTAPGVHTLIIGIGAIDPDPLRCQLTQNIVAAQIAPDALTEERRRELEGLGLRAKEGRTNWFQVAGGDLTPPGNARVEGARPAHLAWETAFAGNRPVSHYAIFEDGAPLALVPHRPQTNRAPFTFPAAPGKTYTVAAVDEAGRMASCAPLRVG